MLNEAIKSKKVSYEYLVQTLNKNTMLLQPSNYKETFDDVNSESAIAAQRALKDKYLQNSDDPVYDPQLI